MDAAGRLLALSSLVDFDVVDAVLVESWSNDAWLTDDAVLRVCWRGDRTRLEREHRLLTALPESIPHASVQRSGVWQDGTWIVLRRIPGERLDLVWPTLGLEQRRQATSRLGALLRSLHRWRAPSEIRSLLMSSVAIAGLSPAEVAGSSLVPLPASRLDPLLAWSEELLCEHTALQRAVVRRIAELGWSVDEKEFDEGIVVHGDAHAANVLWNAGEIVAILDFEWARLGPPDLELEAICRDDPVVEMGMGAGGVRAHEVFALAQLREGYPELFEREHLTERLWLFQLCYELRSLCVWADEGVNVRVLSRLRSLTEHPWVRFP